MADDILKTVDSYSVITVFNAENLKLVGVDLCRPDLLTCVLEAVGVDFRLPTLILSEVVLTYLLPSWYQLTLILILLIFCVSQW